ncbi:unnamed protein product [Cunninghamella blakesleeana]
MGKQRNKNKRNGNRANPIGIKVANGVQQGMNESVIPEDKVLPVLTQLSSIKPEERAWAAACISNLLMSNESTCQLLLSNRIVIKLIERLTDDSREVVEEALGTLRNLASVEPSIVKEYYNRDILTPLSALLPQITQTIDRVLKKEPPVDEADKEERLSIWDFAENFIYIIWAISESSDKYIKAINRLNMINFFISFLSSADQCPTRVVVAAGQCLTTLTEDNKDIFIEFQNHPEYINMLFNILTKFNSPDKILVKVLACAILMNLKEVVQLSGSWDDDRDSLSELNKTILPILVSSLDFDIQEAANQTIAAIQSGNITKHDEIAEEITPKPKQPLTNEEIYIKNVEDRLSTLQLSLEILADICIQNDNDDGQDGWEEADDEMIDGEEDESFVDNINEDNIESYLDDPSAIVNDTNKNITEENMELLKSNPVLHSFIYQIFPKLITLATPTVLSFPSQDVSSSVSATVTLGLEMVHQRSLECFNNFLLAMNDLPTKLWFKEHLNDAKQSWQWLFETAHKIGSAPSSDMRDTVLEVMVGCLWSLGRGLGQEIPLGPNDVATLCGAYQSANQDSSMRVKVVGCLGPIALRQGDINTNKNIGQFIMEILQNPQTNPDVRIESLNLLYDVYSDAAFDYDEPVFVQGDYLSQLKQLLPPTRAMVKAIDRRKQFDLRSRADEALTNLVAFIKYKTNERK